MRLVTAIQLLLWNRVLWLTVSALIFAFAYSRFRFEERAVKPRKIRVKQTKRDAVRLHAPTAAVPHFGVGAQLTQFLGSTRIEFLGLVKSVAFIVITIAALLNCITSLLVSGTDGYGTRHSPLLITSSM